jgi:hypothetical protein
MQLDLEDILASTFGRVLVQVFLFASAVWVGCALGALALVAGTCATSWHDALLWLSRVWASPLLLFSVWLLPNIVVLCGGAGYFLVSENAGFKAWGVVVALESFFVMAGWSMDLKTAGPIAIAWVSWLVLLAMVETGVWLVRQMLTNRWARELAVLNMENARRRAEKEVAERLRMSKEEDR